MKAQKTIAVTLIVIAMILAMMFLYQVYRDLEEKSIQNMEPWERYENGYILYSENSILYHIEECENMKDEEFVFVSKKYAEIKGKKACLVCMPGNK